MSRQFEVTVTPALPVSMTSAEDDGVIVVSVNGRELVGLDFFYVDEAQDGEVPHIAVGHWPDGFEGDWVVLARIPVSSF